ncbi:MAG: serine protein kinase RIO [Methanomassiliicoccales archaeon]|nr:serine protein kinase RIO [Methanomassiliicoccales archaeon]
MPHHDDTFAILERRIQQIKTKDYGAVEDEDRKTLDEVFDKPALLVIYKLMTDGLIETIDFPISTGKEANVFRVTSPDGDYYALKVYRTSNLTFKRISRYIEGDPRFQGLHGSRRKVIFAWATKEFRNLQRLKDAKVRVPEPIKFSHNMLIMEFIGEEGNPAPLLRHVELEDPTKTYKTVIKYVKLAYKKAGLVIGDLSEYNILMQRGEPVIIDVGQGMTVDHFNSKEFLVRDIKNINHFFRSYDVKTIENDVLLKQIMGVKK